MIVGDKTVNAPGSVAGESGDPTDVIRKVVRSTRPRQPSAKKAASPAAPPSNGAGSITPNAPKVPETPTAPAPVTARPIEARAGLSAATKAAGGIFSDKTVTILIALAAALIVVYVLYEDSDK